MAPDGLTRAKGESRTEPCSSSSVVEPNSATPLSRQQAILAHVAHFTKEAL
jgi:hypothetical protein